MVVGTAVKCLATVSLPQKGAEQESQNKVGYNKNDFKHQHIFNCYRETATNSKTY